MDNRVEVVIGTIEAMRVVVVVVTEKEEKGLCSVSRDVKWASMTHPDLGGPST